MFSRTLITKSIKNCSNAIERLKEEIASADAIVIGGGAGLSASAGFDYGGERFESNFADFRRKYGFNDMYAGGFYQYATPEEYWAWWSRNILLNRYDTPVGKPYTELLRLVGDKNYFIITTNVDHQFQLAGFDKKRLFYTQGDYGLWQCSRACHAKTYDNEEEVRLMVLLQSDLQIPSELIPKCPVCGAPMTMNLRCDDMFVQDDGWYAAARRYEEFMQKHTNGRVLFLELGVGYNTPIIIKYPFWKMTAANSRTVYACINYGEAAVPEEIAEQSICINKDINTVLTSLSHDIA